ncbi:hypothetical protein HZS_7328, partial [Henneguya salminicola]
MHYINERIFVNRNIFLEKIQYFGFDMDYTLAEYISPCYEELIYKHALAELIIMGYPANISEFTYNQRFATRGVIFDKRYGNFLKIDPYGNIMSAVHGLDYLGLAESRNKYRNRFIDVVIIGTLTMLCRIYSMKLLYMAYNNFYDWKTYFDVIVVDAVKPKFFVEGLNFYIYHLGTSMCQVDLKTGRKHIGVFKGKISPGDVFAGGFYYKYNSIGNSELLCEILGAQGKDILYVGDHIFGDILKSKKKQGWKTYLVIPELQNEMHMWIGLQDQYIKIEELEAILSNIYKSLKIVTILRNMDSCIIERPDSVEMYISQIRVFFVLKMIKDKTIEIEKTYGFLGSLLRCGMLLNIYKGQRQTFYSGQLVRFADLYSHTCLNLLYYPFFYLFRALSILMPHEATIDFKESSEEEAWIKRQQSRRK